MISNRWTISNKEQTKKNIINLGGKIKGEYSCLDIIFIPQKENNVKLEFIRLRIYKVNNWNIKDIVLSHKKTTWENNYKKDKTILQKEFDNKNEALEFININYKDNIKEITRFNREGEEFRLNNTKIFLENIEFLGSSIEIESDNEKELQELISKIQIKEKLNDSLPETIRKLKYEE